MSGKSSKSPPRKGSTGGSSKAAREAAEKAEAKKAKLAAVEQAAKEARLNAQTKPLSPRRGSAKKDKALSPGRKGSVKKDENVPPPAEPIPEVARAASPGRKGSLKKGDKRPPLPADPAPRAAPVIEDVPAESHGTAESEDEEDRVFAKRAAQQAAVRKQNSLRTKSKSSSKARATTPATVSAVDNTVKSVLNDMITFLEVSDTMDSMLRKVELDSIRSSSEDADAQKHVDPKTRKLNADSRMKRQTARKNAVMQIWQRLPIREQFLLMRSWGWKAQLKTLRELCGAYFEEEVVSDAAWMSAFSGIEAVSYAQGDADQEAMTYFLLCIDLVEDSVDITKFQSRLPKAIQSHIDAMTGQLDIESMQLALQFLPVIDNCTDLIETMDNLLTGVQQIQLQELREEAEVLNVIDDAIDLIDLKESMLDQVVAFVEKGVPLPEFTVTKRKMERTRSVRFGANEIRKISGTDAKGTPEDIAAQEEEARHRARLEERLRRKTADAQERRRSLLGRQSAWEFFPEHFKNPEAISENGSSMHTQSVSSMSESDDPDDPEHSVAESIGTEEAEQDFGSIHDLLRTLKLSDKLASVFEEAELTVTELQQLPAKDVDELISDKGARNKIKAWQKERASVLKERLKDAKKQAKLMKRVAVPDNIHALFTMLKIPLRYADLWESQGKGMSHLVLVAKKDKELKELIPKHGPRMRLKTFLEYHLDELRRLRPEFLKKEASSMRLDRLHTDLEYKNWLAEQREEDESKKKVSADQASAGIAGVSSQLHAKFQMVDAEVSHVEVYDMDVGQKPVKPPLASADEQARWKKALLMSGRGHSSLAELYTVTKNDGEPQGYADIRAGLEHYQLPKAKEPAFVLALPQDARAQRGCEADACSIM